MSRGFLDDDVPSGRSELVKITVKLKHTTERAYLVTADGARDAWVPKSRCQMENTNGPWYEMELPRALAEEKGLV